MGETIIEQQPVDANAPTSEGGITLSLSAQGLLSVKKMLEQEQWYTSLENAQFKILLGQLDSLDSFIVSNQIDINSKPYDKYTLSMPSTMSPILSKCVAFSLQTGTIRLTSEVRALINGLKILK